MLRNESKKEYKQRTGVEKMDVKRSITQTSSNLNNFNSILHSNKFYTQLVVHLQSKYNIPSEVILRFLPPEVSIQYGFDQEYIDCVCQITNPIDTRFLYDNNGTLKSKYLNVDALLLLNDNNDNRQSPVIPFTIMDIKIATYFLKYHSRPFQRILCEPLSSSTSSTSSTIQQQQQQQFTILSLFCKSNRFDILNLLKTSDTFMKTIITMNTDLLQVSVKYGNLQCFKAIITSNNNNNNESYTWFNPHQYILSTIRYGHLHILRYIHENIVMIKQTKVDNEKHRRYNNNKNNNNFKSANNISGGGGDDSNDIVLCYYRWALECAIENGRIQIIRWLFRNVPFACQPTSLPPIDLAASYNQFKMVKWFHYHFSSSIPTTTKNEDGLFDGEGGKGLCTTVAIENAAFNGNLEMVRFLCENRVEGFTERVFKLLGIGDDHDDTTNTTTTTPTSRCRGSANDNDDLIYNYLRGKSGLLVPTS